MSDEFEEIEEDERATSDDSPSDEVSTDDSPPNDSPPDEVTAEETAQAEDIPAEESAAEPAEDPEGLQEGDFVRLKYTGRTVEDGQLVDTTDQAVAEEEGVAEDETFEPRVIILGAGHLMAPVEQDIVGREVGDSGSVVVPTEEAFGERDPDEVRTVSVDKLPEEPEPGGQVTIDGEQGALVTIIGGRARVDFNHPLAGDDLEYEYEILEQVTDPLEQARGLLQVFLDLDLDMNIEEETVEEDRMVYPDEDELDEDEEPGPRTVTETVEKTTLYIEATPQLTMNQEWMLYKQEIAQELINRTDIDRVIVQEILEGGGFGGISDMVGTGTGEGDAGEEIEDALEDADLEDADVDPEQLAEELAAGVEGGAEPETDPDSDTTTEADE